MLKSEERSKKIEKRLKQIPASYKAKYLKTKNTNSLRASIDSFCLECTGWHRADVSKCKCFACPLWEKRPYQSKNNAQSGHNG